MFGSKEGRDFNIKYTKNACFYDFTD